MIIPNATIEYRIQQPPVVIDGIASGGSATWSSPKPCQVSTVSGTFAARGAQGTPISGVQLKLLVDDADYMESGAVRVRMGAAAAADYPVRIAQHLQAVGQWAIWL